MLTQPIKPNQNNSVARTLKILLVDDQKSIQLKLQEMLSSEVEFHIVGTADDGETAIAQIESLQPDVLLLDIEMPKMNGIQTTEIVSQRFPDCRVLVLSSHEDQEYVQQAIAAGADGYILKNADPSDLVMAIHSVSKGYSHFAPKLLPKMQLAKNIQDTSHLDFPQPTSPKPKPIPPRRQFYWQWMWTSLGILVLVSAIAMNTIRALGDMKALSLIVLTSTIINIVLDPLFIFGLLGFPRLELAGAAIATVIAQGTILLGSLMFLHHERLIIFTPSRLGKVWKSWQDIVSKEGSWVTSQTIQANGGIL